MAALLMIRHREEQTALESYALALRDHAAAAKRHETAERDMTAAWHEWRTRIAGGCAVDEILRRQSHCERLAQCVYQCLAELNAAQANVERALHAMLAARQRREGMDKLKTRQHRGWEYNARREEQKQLDELARIRREPEPAFAGHEAN
ncbi:MAG: flagellar FliJ family protein [Verrucomicrobia bacterium]|nr:flagellar FliJ family protein [Verrucomicrobiota bacterium]